MRCAQNRSTSLRIFLRPLVPEDIDYLYRWENAPEVWRYGDCGAHPDDRAEGIPRSNDPEPTERFTRIIENQQLGFEANEQLRLVICRHDQGPAPAKTTPAGIDEAYLADLQAIQKTNSLIPIGFIDLFDFDPVNLSAGVGILICDPADRRKGYGGEALQLITEYARKTIGLRSLWCTISPDNPASLALFRSNDFKETDRRQWHRTL